MAWASRQPDSVASMVRAWLGAEKEQDTTGLSHSSFGLGDGVIVRTLYVVLPSHANAPLAFEYHLSLSLLRPFLSSLAARPASSSPVTTAPPRPRASHSTTSACAPARRVSSSPVTTAPPNRRASHSTHVRLRGYDAGPIVGTATGDGRATVTSGWTRMGNADAGLLVSKRAAIHRWPGRSRRARPPTRRRRRRRRTRRYARSGPCAPPRRRGPALRLDPRRRAMKASRGATGATRTRGPGAGKGQ
jgi:hypothetical protein